MSYRALLLALFLVTIISAIISNASAYGSSVDDLVGVFSIEKTIKLGSSSSCFGSAEGSKDPMGMTAGMTGDPMADNQPPGLAGFNLEPKMLGESSRSINLTAHIVDDESGLDFAEAFFRSPSGDKTAEAIFDPGNRVLGNSKDGIYAAKMILSDRSDSGAWLLENMTLVDGSGNRKVLQREDLSRMNLPAEFMVA